MQILLLAFLCMTLFASNSIFCRIAIAQYDMDPLEYTFIRGVSASLVLCVISWWHTRKKLHNHISWWRQAWRQASWPSALALFAYMLFFSLAYVSMPAAAGTLIINATVQCTMLGWGIARGTRLTPGQTIGLTIVMVGLMALTLPKVDTRPPLDATLLEVGVGIAWGVYSILGREVQDAVLATAGNFFRCVPLLIMTGGIAALHAAAHPFALLHACLAGTLATGCGYIIWYLVVARMSLVSGSIIQLSVPVITAILGAIFLNEAISLHLILCSIGILGGIGLVTMARPHDDR